MSFPMKTGILNEPLQNTPDETLLNFMSVFSLFTEDALLISANYSKHSGRNLVGTEDIIYGLKTRFKHKNVFEQKENILQRLNGIKEELISDPGHNITDDLPFSEEKDVEFVKSTCNCETCQMVNDTIENWDSYIESVYESLSQADKSIIFAIGNAEEKMYELKQT